jgi:hypothetical protein
MVSLLALGLVFVSHPLISNAAQGNDEKRPVEVNVNGNFISMDVHPIMDNAQLFLPIRSLSSLGLSYSWNPSTRITTVKNKNGEYLKITVGSSTAYKGNQPIKIDQAAINKDGRVLVPIRFVTETLGYNVQYDAIRRLVFVTSKDYNFDMKNIYQDDLLAARRTAISLPITANFKTTLGVSGIYHEYRFPLGSADTYIFFDGRFNTFVQIQNGKAIATGQLDESDYSRTAGNVPPNMIFDTDPIMEPFHHSVLFYEKRKGGTATTTAVYTGDKGEGGPINAEIKVYSDIIQALPNDQ